MEESKFLIITGMSGAGKTQVVRTLEDMNFFCIDNLPPALIPMGHEYELLYLDASDDSLIRRYKETRRRHPLGQGKSLSENIAVERERLTEVRNRATHIIDTTDMPTAELKEKIWKLYSGNGGVERMIVLVQSFGF